MSLVLNIIMYEEKIVYLSTTYKKMAKQSTQNVSNYSYNVISNRENLDEKKKKLIDNVKLELFESLNIESKLVNRNELSQKLEILRANNWIWYPFGKVELRPWLVVNINERSYKAVLDQYKELLDKKPNGFEQELHKLDSQLAERLILDKWWAIEFRDWDDFSEWKDTKTESELAYNWLNNLRKYKNKIELVSKNVDKVDYFIIKWNNAELNKIKETEEKIKNAISEEFTNEEHENSDILKENIDEWKDLIPNISEQEEIVKSLQEQNKNLEAQINQKDQEIDELKKQLNDFDSNEKLKEESKEKNKENIEQIDTSLFINRDNLAKAISDSRVGSGFPTWSIEIKSWEYIDLESQDFFEEFKLKYIEAWNNKMRLKDLDTELAERIILSNPKWSDVSKRYQIQINNDEFGQNNKTEEELEKESLRCRDSLQGLGYNVEYITFEENFSDKEKIESKERELLEMQNEEARQKRIILELESELNSKRLHYTEAWRISKQEELKRMKDKLSKLQNDIRLLEDDILKLKHKTKKYHIIKMKSQTIVPPPPVPVSIDPFRAVISDMWTDVFREKAALKVEELLKQDYKNTAWRNMPKRLALFLWRGKKRKKLIKQEMKSMQNTAFQRDAGYSELNEQSQHAADRHAFERMNNLEYGKWGSVVNSFTTVHNAQIDQLCKNYLTQVPPMIDEQFQDQFNTIVAADTNITTALSNNKITHIWTNILLTLQQERASEKLMEDVLTELNTPNPSQWRMNNLIETYIKDFQTNPNFLTVYQNYLNNSINTIQLKNHLIHQQTAMKMRVANLKMNIDIVNKWKSAYQMENSDREKWKWSWKFKLWNWMDKHPRLTTAGSLWISVWLWLATAWLWAVAWAAVTTAGFAGLVWTTNAVKKWTHHTKEQNTHEKNRVTDYRNEQRKIQEWQNQALNGRWWKKYKAKRQLALYDQTTQENIKLSNQITEIITNLSSKTTQLTTNELQAMHWSLIEWWARLKYYQETGHNFLASESVDQTEKDMKRLEKAIYLWLNKIWKNTSDIENNSIVFTDTLWNNITYSVLKNDLKESYDKSLVQFKRERRNLSLKYWIWTAVASAGMALGMQYLLWTWVFAKDTPGTIWSTTSYSGWTDTFNLWSAEITNGNVYSSTGSAISWSPNWSSVLYTYWVWTDWTQVIPGHLTSTDLSTKIADVTTNINSMTGLSATQKSSAIAELSRLSYTGFTNDNLAAMRAAENIEHFAQAISDAGRNDLVLNFSSWWSLSWSSYNNLAERFMTWKIDITTPDIPWKEASTWWRWIMWVPLFFNTFKNRKGKKDTQDPKIW